MILPFRKRQDSEAGIGPVARLRGLAGWMAQRLRLPGAVRSVAIKDELSGQRIVVDVGVQFVRLSVDGRDHYFHRLTGRYAGTGAVIRRLHAG